MLQQGIAWLMVLALLMSVVTFALGYLPQYITHNAKLMKLLQVFGAGNLLGITWLILFPEALLAIS